jgi:hypothetical protein
MIKFLPLPDLSRANEKLFFEQIFFQYLACSEAPQLNLQVKVNKTLDD